MVHIDTDFPHLYYQQGKMPVLVTSDGFTVVESDSIARYLLDKYNDKPPSCIPSNLYERSLSDQICRVHDIYISPIQGCMYKAPGSIFSTFGTDRKAALAELKRQLLGIEQMLPSLDSHTSQGASRPFLCGSEISLADATLYPTLIFCEFMLPQFFGWSRGDYMGKRLSAWFDRMGAVPAAKAVREEMMAPLEGWKANGRFDPIVKEMAV